MPRPRSLLDRQFSSLRVYNYRLYFGGQLVSFTGTWMQRTAQAWLVLRLTGSPAALGTVAALQFLPITLLTLFGGVFADRLPKRRLLIFTNAASMLQALGLGLLVVTGTAEIWHVYLFALSLGIVNALDGPVRQSFAVELVGREQLVNAVALNSSTFNAARIVGPAVAGLIIGAAGNSTAFFLNAASFVPVILSFVAMRPGEMHGPASGRAGGGNVFGKVGEGLRYAGKTPAVLFLLIMLAAIGTFGFNFTVFIPLIAEFILKVGPERFGLLTSFMGAGSLVAALTMAAFGKGSTRVIVTAGFAFAIFLASVALSPWFLLTGLLLAAFGAASQVFSTNINTTLQVIVPDELRGRVLSIYFLLMAGSTPIGGYLTGRLAESIGVAETLVIEAAICGAGVAGALCYRAFVDRPRPGAVQPVADEGTLASG